MKKTPKPLRVSTWTMFSSLFKPVGLKKMPVITYLDPRVRREWWASFGGGGGQYSPLASPPSPKKGSIDGPAKILPRLTPGPRR